MAVVTDPIRRVSSSFPKGTLDRILQETKPFTESGHFLYPADESGVHTKGFFAFEPIAGSKEFVDAIADDIRTWARETSIDADVVFAPASPAVRPLAEAVGARLHRPRAYWEYLPSGRFGNRLVEGTVPRGSTALALNAVSLQGRCVGLRLPQFVQGLGGQVTAAAVFAKGTGVLVRETEDWLGDRFYSTIQVDVPIFPPTSCPACQSSPSPPIPWREFAEAPR
jgi:hypothetical protein